MTNNIINNITINNCLQIRNDKQYWDNQLIEFANNFISTIDLRKERVRNINFVKYGTYYKIEVITGRYKKIPMNRSFIVENFDSIKGLQSYVLGFNEAMKRIK